MTCGAVLNYGRGALTVKREQMALRPLQAIASQCTDVMTAITAHPDGQLTACCGVMVRQPSLLTLGNWRSEPLQPILQRAQTDLILNWIRYLGLRDMHRWLGRRLPGLRQRDRYASICDLCADLLYDPACRDQLLASGMERHDEILAHRLALQAGAESGPRFIYGRPSSARRP